ncbi:MAG: LysE family transporter [Chloroflexi bacterium]|nr:LysE family transporter [Chloroflexota bacterium]
MTALLTQAASFGFAAGTSFGSLHMLLMSVTLAQGWRYGLLIVLSPLLTDAPIIVLMVVLLSSLPPIFAPLLNIVGGVAVFFIAWRAYQSLRRPLSVEPAGSAKVTRETLLRGIVVNLLNPAPYIFWGTMTGPLLVEAFAISAVGGLLFLLAFYGVFLGLMTLFVVMFDRLRGVDVRLTRWLTMASLVVLAALGVQLILRGINGLSG